MNSKRRSAGSARRRAEEALLKEQVEISEPKPLIDSETTRATPTVYDPPETEETLP